MELYDLISPVEMALARKADALRHPLGGTMELTPLCNMNCQMCFIRQDPQEVARQGRILSCDEWLKIAAEAKEAGVLTLLLTGGEPLIYPEFRRLYTSLTDMGFVLTINTNGTLIDEAWADLFAERPCRRLNITIYAGDDASYGRICRNPKGYTQLMHALDLLDERKIMYRLNFTPTPDNIDFFPAACAEAKRRRVPIAATNYLFPPIRRENTMFERILPEQAAQLLLDKIRYTEGEKQRNLAAINELKKLRIAEINRPEGLLCRAGRSGFWMSWNGDLLPCGMFLEPKVSLLEHSFGEAWKIIVEETAKLRMYAGCRSCDMRQICQVCGAGCLTESGGDMQAKPAYICSLTQAYYQLLKHYAALEEDASSAM